MAGIKISSLSELTQLQNDFYFVIVDTIQDKTKKFNSINLNLGQIAIGSPISGSYPTTGSHLWTSQSIAADVLLDINEAITSMSTGSHLQNTDIGTINQSFKLRMSGSTSVLLKEYSGSLQVRNSTDTSLSEIYASDGHFYTIYGDTLVVSSSVIYSSGSTKFGDTLDDTHQITGSLSITGSIYSAIISSSIPSQNVIFTDANGIFTGSSSFYYDGSALNIVGGLEASYKSFKIQHPTKPGKMLIHGSLEGPEHSVFVRGKSSELTIHLPEYWTELVDENTITVQLTPIGSWQELHVQHIKNNTVFVSQTLYSKLLGILTDNLPEFYYFICGERKDISKLQAEI